MSAWQSVVDIGAGSCLPVRIGPLSRGWATAPACWTAAGAPGAARASMLTAAAAGRPRVAIRPNGAGILNMVLLLEGYSGAPHSYPTGNTSRLSHRGYQPAREFRRADPLRHDDDLVRAAVPVPGAPGAPAMRGQAGTRCVTRLGAFPWRVRIALPAAAAGAPGPAAMRSRYDWLVPHWPVPGAGTARL